MKQLLLCLLFCLAWSQDEPTKAPVTPPPIPALQWPTTFHAWIVVSIVDSEHNQTIILNRGENIAFDMVDNYTCRYMQQNLTERGASKRATDFCDYDQGLHFQIKDDADQDTPCTLRKAIDPPAMVPFTWPSSFFHSDSLEYLGLDKVADWYCNHWLNLDVDLDGQTIQLDVWTRNDSTQYPCQMSAHEQDSGLHINWAFVAFSPTIPQTAKRCTAPRVICDEKTWVCRPVLGINDTDYYSMALHYACENPEDFSCAPINPGGKFYEPNDLMAHCTWAFQAYFEKYKMLLGEDACMYGVAELVKPSVNGEPEEIYRRLRHDERDWRALFAAPASAQARQPGSRKYFGEKKRLASKNGVAANPLLRYMRSFLVPDPIKGIPNDLVCFETQ